MIDNKNSGTNSVVIEFSFLPRKLILTGRLFTGLFDMEHLGIVYFCPFYLYTFRAGDIVNKNSSVVIRGETVVEQTNSSPDIQLITIDPLGDNAIARTENISTDNFSIKYYPAYPINSHTRVYNYIDEVVAYAEYIEFKQHSNIPLSVEMFIPTNLLESLVLNIPKIVAGQKLMIEKIVQKVGVKGTQMVTFRTLRPFIGRVNSLVIPLVSITTSPSTTPYAFLGQKYYDSRTKLIYTAIISPGAIWVGKKPVSENTVYLFKADYYVWNGENLIVY